MIINIKSYSVLVAIVGLISMLFFFPSSQGCSDFNACLLYSSCGLILLILSIGLFLLNEFAGKCMVWFSLIYAVLFIFQTIWLIRTDHTGQGLVGMVLLTPILLMCIFGLILLSIQKTKKEFHH